MPRLALAFGELLTDQPDFANPGLEIASGVIPAAKGYSPLQQFAEVQALGFQVLGGASFRASNRQVFTFLGSSTGLYLFDQAGLRSVGTGYSASENNRWRFLTFGDRVIATNGSDLPVKFDMLTDTAFTILSNAPTIGLFSVVRDFIFAGVINGDAATVQWSGINNSESWSPGLAQSDYQPLPSGGAITAVTGGEYGLVFQETAINYFSYVGGNVIFQRDEISTNIGCVSPNAFAQYGKTVFFLSARGFMSFDGSAVNPIGNEKVDATFLAAAALSGYKRMTCAVDPVRKIVAWSVPSLGTPDTVYIYNFLLNRWSTAPLVVESLWSGLSAGTSLDALDLVSPSIDALPLSLDDDSYKGGVPSLFAARGGSLGTLTGPNMEATFGFGDIEPISGAWAKVRTARPVADAAGGYTLSFGGKARQGDAPTVTSYGALRASGDMPVRENWRVIRPSLTIAAGTPWTTAQGLELLIERGGRR